MPKVEAGARGGCVISSSGSVRGESSSRSVKDDRDDRGDMEKGEGEEIDGESTGERSTDGMDIVRDDKVETDELLIHLPV